MASLWARSARLLRPALRSLPSPSTKHWREEPGQQDNLVLPHKGINLQHSFRQVKRSIGPLWLSGRPGKRRPALPLLTQPFAIFRGDEGAKPRHAGMLRRSRLEIAQNLPQRQARHRPIVGALPQHELRVADRPAHDLINEAVHRGARCLSVGDNKPGTSNGKGGAVDVMTEPSRFGAERRNGIRRRRAIADRSHASIWDCGRARLKSQKRDNQAAIPFRWERAAGNQAAH